MAQEALNSQEAERKGKIIEKIIIAEEVLLDLRSLLAESMEVTDEEIEEARRKIKEARDVRP